MQQEMQPKELVLIFARNVKAYRLARGWTQADLAAQMEVHVPYISAIENGKRTPFLGNVARFAEALGTTPDALLADGEKISA